MKKCHQILGIILIFAIISSLFLSFSQNKAMAAITDPIPTQPFNYSMYPSNSQGVWLNWDTTNYPYQSSVDHYELAIRNLSTNNLLYSSNRILSATDSCFLVPSNY